MARLKKAAAIKKLSGKEKAAIFLLALGCEPSAAVFAHLNPQDVEILSYQIASTEKVDSNLLSQVLIEFKQLITARDYVATGGVDYAKKLLSKAFGEKRSEEIIQKISVFLHKKPFEFVKRVRSDRLVSFLKYEQPQTIALVLAYLEPEAASRHSDSESPGIQSFVLSSPFSCLLQPEDSYPGSVYAQLLSVRSQTALIQNRSHRLLHDSQSSSNSDPGSCLACDRHETDIGPSPCDSPGSHKTKPQTW